MVTASDASTNESRYQARTPLEVTLAVWKALFLREVLTRLFSTRTSMVWLFLEPAFHVAYLMVIYTTIRVRVIGGLDTLIWLMAGMLPFILFRRVASRTAAAVDSNQPLFTYRQVQPLDAVFVRAALELFIMAIVAVLISCGIALIGRDITPDDPLEILAAVFGMWLCGLGWGMIISVGQGLVSDVRQLNSIMMMPLYILSGTMISLSSVSPQFLDVLMLNPLAHGLEICRHGFSDYYYEVPATSMAYLYSWAVGLVFSGLVLHKRFARKLMTR